MSVLRALRENFQTVRVQVPSRLDTPTHGTTDIDILSDTTCHHHRRATSISSCASHGDSLCFVRIIQCRCKKNMKKCPRGSTHRRTATDIDIVPRHRLSDVRKPLPAPAGRGREYGEGAGTCGRDGDRPGHGGARGKLRVSLEALHLWTVLYVPRFIFKKHWRLPMCSLCCFIIDAIAV